MTDKPYYTSGEDLYFSAYLNTADYFQGKDRIVYAELWSKNRQLIVRHILSEKDGQAKGEMDLDPQLPMAWYGLMIYNFEMTRQPFELPLKPVLIWNVNDDFRKIIRSDNTRA